MRTRFGLKNCVSAVSDRAQSRSHNEPG